MVTKIARVLALLVVVASLTYVLGAPGFWTRYWFEQEVYSEAVTIVDEIYPGRKLLVRSKPSDCTVLSFRWTESDALGELYGVSQETLDNYIANNGKDAFSSSFWKLRNQIRVLDESDVRQLVAKRPYGTFSLIGFVPHDEVFISLSRVGFNRSLEQAVLCVEFVVAKNVGVGLLLNFKKDSRGWKNGGILRTWP